MTRQILLDTETTGLDPATGDRIIEIAAIELQNLVPTGQQFHALLDPERDIPEEATRVHGFTRAMLAGKPSFAALADELLDFLGGDPIIAHNAPFDFGFLDAELRLSGRPPLDRSRMVCTLVLAKKRFPGLPNSLDALCNRYNIDLSKRTTNNALLDVKLLAQVYLELMGGRQPGLALLPNYGGHALVLEGLPRVRRTRPILPDAGAMAAHRAFLAKLKDPVWLRPEFAWPEPVQSPPTAAAG